VKGGRGALQRRKRRRGGEAENQPPPGRLPTGTTQGTREMSTTDTTGMTSTAGTAMEWGIKGKTVGHTGLALGSQRAPLPFAAYLVQRHQHFYRRHTRGGQGSH
jgi:hypothetical protein